MQKNYRKKCPKCNGKGTVHIIPKGTKDRDYFEPCSCNIKKVKAIEPKHYNINPYALRLKGIK